MRFEIGYESINRLYELLKQSQDNNEATINDVLHNEAGPLINDAIIELLPVSGKNWKGKKAAAKTGNPFFQGNLNLAVVIKTKTNYGYLYFPDDGTNTRKHIGEKYFMLGGAEQVQNEIIDRCIAKITEKINKGAN